MGTPWEARVAAYVDSPSMRLRRIEGSKLSARIDGNYGSYRVKWDTKKDEGSCSCPSDGYPCKHIEALRRTWEKNPASFRAPPKKEAQDFPPERLVFQEAKGHVWRCPCGKASQAAWRKQEEAIRAAGLHVADHAVKGGLTDDEILDLAEDIEEQQEEKRIQDAAEKARRRFESGRFGSMQDAVDEVAEELELDGFGDRSGDMSEVMFLLEQEFGGALEDWTRTEKEERRFRHILQQARERFVSRQFESMGHAAMTVAKEFGLKGDEEEGEVGELFGVLAGNWDDEPLWDWKCPSPETSKEIQSAVQRALRRFQFGLYDGIEEAAYDTALHFGYSDGTGDLTARIATLIADMVLFQSPVKNPSDWKPPRRSSITLRDALTQAGIGPATRANKGDTEECPGCESPFEPREKDVVVIDGRRVHEDWQCINHAFGPDHSVVLRIEEALAGNQSPAPQTIPYWRWTDDAKAAQKPKRRGLGSKPGAN